MQAPSLRKSEFFTIEMRHVPTSSPGKLNRVKFEGWVTEFADRFDLEEGVEGRRQHAFGQGLGALDRSP